MLKSIEKHTTRPMWLAEWTVYLFLRENGTGTTKYGYYGWFSTVLGYLFCLSMPIVYQVYRFALLLRPLSSVFFWRFHVFTRTSFILLFNHYSHLGKYVRIFMRTNHARNMKHTLAITQFCRGFGTLILPRAGFSHPNWPWTRPSI